MRFFSEKNSIFTPKILMTFFSHRPGFSDFYSCFPDSPYLYCVKYRISFFLHKKKHYFRKEFFDDTYFFTLFKLSRPSHNTTSQNIGGPMHGPSIHLKFLGGTVPPVPLGFRPCW